MRTAGRRGGERSGRKNAVKSVGAPIRLRILPGRASATRIVRMSPTCTQQAEPVYDLTVERHHCYEVSGVLVSNSDGLGYMIAREFPVAEVAKSPMRPAKPLKYGRILGEI